MQETEKESRLKFSMRISPQATDDELLFARQLGVEYVYTWVGDDQRNKGFLLDLRRKVDDADLTLYNVGNVGVGKCDKIHLALPGREEEIEAFKAFIRNLGEAGIHVTTFTWEQAGVWSSEERGESRGASARRVEMEELHRRPFTHDRAYTEEEIWDNFRHFTREIIPVAEDADVRLALHPNDPPVPSLGGVPCLIHSFEDYKRAFEIADSPYLGMEFCTGCWLEGGEGFGDILEGLRYCSERDRIFIVHFRNVSSPLPSFTEAFLDNGYMDMYKLMKILFETGYDGTVTLDHTPAVVYGRSCGTAYAIGYMRALLERAEDELGCQR